MKYVTAWEKFQDSTDTKPGFHHSTLIAEVSGSQGIRADHRGKKIFSIYAHQLTELGGWPWAF